MHNESFRAVGSILKHVLSLAETVLFCDLFHTFLNQIINLQPSFSDNKYGNKDNEPIPLKFLASGGWLHYKSKGDFFTINTHSKVTL